VIKAIKFVNVPVADQDRALEFYTKRLGFVVATDQPFDDEQRWIELRIPSADTRIVLFTPAEHVDRIGTPSHITFLADDVDETFRQLRERGVEFDEEPQHADWGSAAVFRDPDGNTFVLSSR